MLIASLDIPLLLARSKYPKKFDMKKIINEDYTLCRISFYFDLFFLPVEADPFLLLPFFLDTIFRIVIHSNY
jgi:hypothetical protein